MVTEPPGFREFVEQHSTALLRAAWMLTGDWAAAEDLVQGALAAAWPRWSSITVSHLAYVRRSILNAYLRRRFDVTVAAVVPDVATDDESDQVTTRQAVLQALAGLSRQQRAAVVLRYFVDLSEADAARAMRCSPGAVKSHLSRALARLRDDPSLTDLLTGGAAQ